MKTTRLFESRGNRPIRIVVPCDFIDGSFQPRVQIESEPPIATLYLPEPPRSDTVNAQDEPTRGVFTFDW